MARGPSARLLFAARALLLLIGAVLILSAARLKAGSEPSLACFSVGVSLIAAAIISALATFFGTDVASQIEDRMNFQREIYNSGLDRIWMSFSDEYIFEQMTRARTIDLLFNSGKGFTNSQGPRVRDALLHGCRIRIAVADPSIYAYVNSDMTAALCPGTNVPEEIREAVAFFDSVISELRSSGNRSDLGSLEVRQFHCFPSMTLVIVDQAIARFTGYLPYVHGSEAPVYQVRANSGSDSLLSQYQRAFDRVWTKSTTVIKFPAKQNSVGRRSAVTNQDCNNDPKL